MSFGVSWLPWNLYMTLSNFGAIIFSGTHGFIQCHLVGTPLPIRAAELHRHVFQPC